MSKIKELDLNNQEKIDYKNLLEEQRRTIKYIKLDLNELNINYDYINTDGKVTNHNTYIFIHTNPTSNCQLYSIGDFMTLQSFSKNNIAFILGYIRNHVNSKYMLLLDLNENVNLAMSEKLNYISRNRIQTNYESSNDSHMVINIIRLNVNLLDEIFSNLKDNIRI